MLLQNRHTNVSNAERLQNTLLILDQLSHFLGASGSFNNISYNLLQSGEIRKLVVYHTLANHMCVTFWVAHNQVNFGCV
jgi:hypothetical protein